jgi:predicted ArsR family transcriptional regulator
MQATREHILNILKEQQQATVDDLSAELGLTAVTVRHHLEILRGEGLVGPPTAQRRKGPGRPQYVYSLAEKASSFFPKRYDHLARLLIDELRTHIPDGEMDTVMARIGRHIAQQAPLEDDAGTEDRLTAAIEFLNSLGYMASWEPTGDEGASGQYLVHIANCPYERVAFEKRDVCTMDLALLTSLLDTSPQRVLWAGKNSSKCTYAVSLPAEQDAQDQE